MPMEPLPAEPTVIDARLPFAEAQTALSGVILERRGAAHNSCSWFGTGVLLERGCFALVQRDGPLEEFVGDRLRLTYGRKCVLVYCVGTATVVDVPFEIGITRRAFQALELLSVDRIDVLVEVVSG